MAANPEELLRAGDVPGALAALREKVRNAPADAASRKFLFQMLCVAGEWEKALTQLDILADLESEEFSLLPRLAGPLIGCEMVRAEVFQGKKSPLIFGEPAEWIGLMVQANVYDAEKNHEAAQKLREQALEAAQAVGGKLNDEPFEWIADADSRLGPLLEAIIDGKYFWVPIERIQSLALEPPAELRDMVWARAQFVWANGGEAWGHIPVRYAGSENSADGAVQLARKTEWIDAGGGSYLGMGQRMLATDSGEHPLLEVRRIELQPATAA